MCGRTTLTITPDDLERTFGFPVPPGYRARYNIAPSQDQLALMDHSAGRGFRFLRFGMIPFWADDPRIGTKLINARAETIASKPAFRTVFVRRRCLVVVDGWYEWQVAPGGKRPHRIHHPAGAPMTLGAVWDRWDRGDEVIESCAIITTSANETTAPIHDRMPVVIGEGDRELWLDSGTPREELEALLVPCPPESVTAYEVSTLVNSPANDSPACLERVEPPLTLL